MSDLEELILYWFDELTAGWQSDYPARAEKLRATINYLEELKKLKES